MAEFESVWESAGTRVAASLDDASAVVVLGHDPIATAAVALGIGRAQAQHRRVAIGDLIGDVAPLRDLVLDDDPHGITDSFIYGVSLNKIARQVDAIGNLHVLPSGSDLVVQDDILRNGRWRRLASGFHEVGALLLIAAPAAVPGVEDLIPMLDGVVLVGGATSPAPNARVFAEVATPTRRAAPRPVPRMTTEVEPVRRRQWLVPTLAAAAVVAIAAVLGRNYLTRSQAAPAPAVVQRDSAAASDTLVTAGQVAVDSAAPLVAENPGDSAEASRFAVQIAMVDTEDGAAARVRTGGGDFPVGTYAPVTRGADRGTWYKVVTGAYTDSTRAVQLLGFLRQRGLVPQGWGSVVRAPYALQLTTASSETQAAAVIADYQSRQIPVYGLRQRDGSVKVYAGAFGTPDEASLYKSALKSTKNIDATLVYRVGRAF